MLSDIARLWREYHEACRARDEWVLRTPRNKAVRDNTLRLGFHTIYRENVVN